MGEILDLDLDPDHDNFAKVLDKQVTVCEAIMRTAVKTDENTLRKRAVDTLPKLIELLNREEARLPKRLGPATIDAAYRAAG